MKSQTKILFFGNERLATGVTTDCPTLKALIQNNYQVAAIVLHNKPSTSRKQRKLEIAEIAEQNNIPVIYPEKLAESIDELKLFGAEIGVLVAFGKIVPQPVIDIFPCGIINVHPSKLPKHRGPTPLESVILNGESETAVSVMKLVKEMDAGPVYAKRTLSVPSDTSKQALADSASQLGSEIIVQSLPQILDGTLKPQPQDEQLATYDQLLHKDNGIIDWTKSAEQLEREIRAYAGWPKSIASVGNHEFIVLDADVVNTSGKPGNYLATKKELVVYCGQDALQIKQLQPVNKKEMPVEAFLAGYSL